MSEFFKGLRRKFGCVTLLMALVFMGGWLRSMVVTDRWEFLRGDYDLRSLSSSKGYVAWLKVVPCTASQSSTNSEWPDESEKCELSKMASELSKMTNDKGGEYTSQMQIAVNKEKMIRKIFRAIAPGFARRILARKFKTMSDYEQEVCYWGSELVEVCYDRNSPHPIQGSMWRVSYWLLITPLTLISAFLLLKKPKTSTPKNKPEPIQDEGI